MAENIDEPDASLTSNGTPPGEITGGSVQVSESDAAPISTQYKMDRQLRGTALIINNMEFSDRLKLPPRKESQKDVVTLNKLFEDWGLTVKTLENATLKQTEAAFEEEATKKDNKDCDCFVGVILSHGSDDNHVYAHDNFINLNGDIYQHFKGKDCTLAGKPKIFFIQACRGHKVQSGVEEADASPGSPTRTISSEHDFLYVYSTVPGFYAFKRNEGSWLVQSIKKAVEEHGADKELSWLIKRANDYMAEYSAESSKFPGAKQSMWVHSTLRKDIYFK